MTAQVRETKIKGTIQSNDDNIWTRHKAVVKIVSAGGYIRDVPLGTEQGVKRRRDWCIPQDDEQAQSICAPVPVRLDIDPCVVILD